MNKEFLATVLAGLAGSIAAFLLTESVFAGVLTFFATAGFVVYGVVIADELNNRLRRHYTGRDF